MNQGRAKQESMENKIEILAPAGGIESLIAAVRSGADAVYVGEKSFSARTSAQNFDADELKKAVAYCHIHGVKVYVTINTIIFDDEFEELKNAIITAAEADVDALIVQNMGVARLAQRLVPEMPLHASTQMSIHTASGVRALYEMGFKRVVLSREMSKKEIAKAAEVPIELEVFVHGALCMSVSGQCYFSAMLGSRSGNRGACAQTCRLPFSIEGERNGHALSLKDNSLIKHISTLQEMGVASAKIEGRMKRPEYVSVAVRACAEQRENGCISEQTWEMLRGVFSRTGFTDGYFTGNTGREMFGTRTKEDVISANEKLFSEIRQSYKDEIRNIPISGKFEARLGKVARLKITDGEYEVEVTGEKEIERAINKATDKSKCEKQLSKTGGTAYYIKNLEIIADEEIAVPMSEINALRRKAIEELDNLRSRWHNYQINDFEIKQAEPHIPPIRKKRYARATTTKLGNAFKEFDLVFIPLFTDTAEIERLRAEGFRIGAEIPRGMFGREERIREQLKRLENAGITEILSGNIGGLYLAREAGMNLHGDFGLNIVNTYDIEWAEEYGLKDIIVSFELTYERINRLGGRLARGIISNGYLPLMLCRNCPNKSAGIDCKACRNEMKIQDRRGEQFLLKCDGNCTEILNCVRLVTTEEELSTLSTDFHLMRFNVENYVEKVENSLELMQNSMLKTKITHGLYHRGVK